MKILATILLTFNFASIAQAGVALCADKMSPGGIQLDYHRIAFPGNNSNFKKCLVVVKNKYSAPALFTSSMFRQVGYDTKDSIDESTVNYYSYSTEQSPLGTVNNLIKNIQSNGLFITYLKDNEHFYIQGYDIDNNHACVTGGVASHKPMLVELTDSTNCWIFNGFVVQ